MAELTVPLGTPHLSANTKAGREATITNEPIISSPDLDLIDFKTVILSAYLRLGFKSSSYGSDLSHPRCAQF